ncbi:hypothetical protein VTK26DRAFT_6391 [Humicola hyalothermophila]
MAQTSNSTADPSRERAVSSEPCSTRPNPFDDGDSASRKRRRTSLASDSRSRSVETFNSSPAKSAADLQMTDSAMKIDLDPAIPKTPDQQLLDAEPTSEPRSSRVTINVRTPSQSVEAGVALPPPLPSPDSPTSQADAVEIAVDEPGQTVPHMDTVNDTPAASTPDSERPPVVSLSSDDDADFDGDQSVATLDESGVSLIQDPSPDFPYHDLPDPYLETACKISHYLPSHEQVSRSFTDWIEKYLVYVRAVPPRNAAESYYVHREVWQAVPELVMFMVNRKVPYPRLKDVRQEIFTFYRSFAKLTAYFVDLDLRTLRSPGITGQSHWQSLLASQPYVHALAALTRRDEIILHLAQLTNGDDDWSYSSEVTAILETFQRFSGTPGGSLTDLRELAHLECDLVSEYPRLTDHIADLCVLTANTLSHGLRRAQANDQQILDKRACIIGSYALFKTVAPVLSDIIEKNPNRLSHEGAGNLIASLTEIYQMCLGTTGVVPPDIINEHRQSHPPIAPQHVSEAMAYHWKFSRFVKLIKSGQMQLRVMAVSTMCNDLVAIYKKHNESLGDDATGALFRYLADFLLKTGLVNYILGPTCHPEITVESSNIIGFLLVSNTYSNEHTDSLWQTVTTTQDPRVSDALLRMAARIANLFRQDALMYFCVKLSTVPVEVFGPSMRDFCDSVIKHLVQKLHDGLLTDAAPYSLCIRLIRQSSVFGSRSPVAYPDIQQFAIQKLDSILTHGPGMEGRWEIYMDCLRDIARKPPSALGSLWVLKLATRYNARDFHVLASEHDLARLLIDELESAIPTAAAAGFPAVISGAHNSPRKDLLMLLVSHEAGSLTGELGSRLWELLVGSKSACREDRDVAWQSLNSALKRTQSESSFTSTCFAEYLPSLDPRYFCQGALDFVRDGVLPLVNDQTSIVLDDEDNPAHPRIELLWRMALTAPNCTIEQRAIQTLVRDVYIESRSIQSFPHYRARKVHLALVARCLSQLSTAAARLKASADGTAGGDDDSMVILATDQQLHEQELLFIRSLAILREFHRLHQAKPEFSAPDIRSLILEPPQDVEGESAELKYQSFDGETQTTVMPLNIGKLNTAASLLASLRKATGFENYRIYYRGRPFVPHEREICKSLADLQIHNGIILVKKEPEPAALPSVPVGASPVEVEILRRFDELWEYLSMEEKLAREIYGFLIKLPADEKALKAIDDPSHSYQAMFPLGQPFKSLYAVHVLREYLDSPRPQPIAGHVDTMDGDADGCPTPNADCLTRTMSLVVPAISDPEIVDRCPSRELQIELGSELVDLFVSLLRDPELPPSAVDFLNSRLLDRLLAILSMALSAESSERAIKSVPLCLQSILESCWMSDKCMLAFCSHAEVPRLLEDLLLNEPRATLRQSTALLLRKACGQIKDDGSSPDIVAPATKLREFIWPLVSRLVGPAISKPSNSTEVLGLCFELLQALRSADSEILDLEQLSKDWFSHLLNYVTDEDPTKPDDADIVAFGLIRLLHAIVCGTSQAVRRGIAPASGIARRIFWTHLFPPPEGKAPESSLHKPIVSSQTRGFLLDIVFSLVEDDPTQFMWLLEDMAQLVPVCPNQDDVYAYELPQQFERAKAIRAPCGYVGLRNLSNTCYFNSLFTQLFMNVDFRRFMLAATVRDRDYAQGLLFATQKVFAYMQNSLRRFISPDDCVGSIRTYEDTQIDVGIQMDVDEFYNLLCDRWEGQFLTSDEKNRFRSLYGGQLVQQVRSQECEHVSERLEPFSAIQCDIKGMSSLQESLQAYVDGEIMEGDNKYKCSTCDRHVDAVKRACLKDIPDNLIFHLKRFDFNLRTMQRSKINDYFSFPDKIDMRPYTIEHLSNPSEETTEDIFELVGVLVHSGTAESGHYYSYIRERPTDSETPKWIEFNDDAVSSWDPTQMASSCFGGPDYQTQFQSGNSVYDKQYSAYMLFYQRSSSLAKNQDLLRQPGCSVPLAVDVPKDMREWIEEENTWYLRRHCLYDPAQIQFVCLILLQLKSFNPNGCSADHTMESNAIYMALGHLDQVASRAKDTPGFQPLLNRIRQMCQSCTHCSMTVYKYFTDYPETLRMLVQRNMDAEVRQATASFFIENLQFIKARVPEQYGIPTQGGGQEEEEGDADWLDPQTSVIAGVIPLFDHLWQTFQVSLRSWLEVFDFMLAFVKLGRHELAAFLAQPFFLRWLLLIVSADAAEFSLSGQFMKMVAVLSRRPPSRAPSYVSILSLLDVLLANVRLRYTEDGQVAGANSSEERVRLNENLDQPFDMTRSEAELLHMTSQATSVNIFIDKLISIAQNDAATDSIITNLMRQSRHMEDAVFHTLLQRITGQIAQPIVSPYLRVAGSVFLPVASNAAMVRDLIRHVSQECLCIQNSEGRAFLDFMRQTFEGPRDGSGETVQQVLMTALQYVPLWAPGLLGYFDTSVIEETEALLQEKIFQWRTFRAAGENDGEAQDDGTQELADKMRFTARTLGFRCLWFLRDNYVLRNMEVTERAIGGLQRVIRQCSRYFNVKEPTEDEEAREFVQLSQNIMDALSRLLVVDELEEEGSDWEDSSICSTPFGDTLTGKKQGGEL